MRLVQIRPLFSFSSFLIDFAARFIGEVRNRHRQIDFRDCDF